jgi:hypothetical protein
MNYFIEKNLLLDDIIDLLKDNLSYDNNIYHILGDLRNNNDINQDIILFRNLISNIDNIIYEATEYAKTIIDLYFEYNYILRDINDLYNAKYQIINFINKINEIDVLSDLVSEIKIKNN